jgi:hypothetical protein
MEDHHDDVLKIALSASEYDTLNPPHEITRIWDTSRTIMSYISGQLLDAGGESVSEDQLETLQTLAEDHAIKHVHISSSHPPPDTAPIPVPSASSLAQSSILQYEGELHAVIKKHRDSILQLLMSVPTSGPPPDLLLQYDKLRGSHFPIMTGLSGLISHLGRKRISNHDLEILICNAEDKAIKLHASAMTKRVSPSAGIPASEEKVVDLADNSIPFQDPVQPLVKPKLALNLVNLILLLFLRPLPTTKIPPAQVRMTMKMNMVSIVKQ